MISKKETTEVFSFSWHDKNIYNQIIVISANIIFTKKEIQVETITSTNEGVAFIVSIDGKTIYHSGDSHLWLWTGESDDYNKNIDYLFKLEMAKIKNRHFDVTFLVLDPQFSFY